MLTRIRLHSSTFAPAVTLNGTTTLYWTQMCFCKSPAAPPTPKGHWKTKASTTTADATKAAESEKKHKKTAKISADELPQVKKYKANADRLRKEAFESNRPASRTIFALRKTYGTN
eukprot:PhF_6_TR42438/c0_g1_i1/m.64006